MFLSNTLFIIALFLFHLGAQGGILEGFLHPLLGLDHLLAMVGVGMLSAQMGGRAIWTVPATFVTVMAGGGLLGLLGLPLPAVEYGVTASVLALGVAIVVKRSVPVWLGMVFVGVFALFHGYAHGTELPKAATTVGHAAAYVGGFLMATAGLHLIGALLGVMAERSNRGELVLRGSGALIALVGILLISQV